MTLEIDISEFMDNIPEHIKEGRKLTLKHQEIENFVKNHHETPFSKTAFLGKQEKELKPSNYLVTNLHVDKNFIKVDEEKEWLFLCGRDIFIKLADPEKLNKKIIIKNKFDENIGIALVQKNMLKNVLDIGTYIRS